MKFAVGRDEHVVTDFPDPRPLSAPERIWSALPHLLALFTPEGEVVSANPAWCALLSEPRQKLEGARLDRLMHADDIPQAELAFKRTADTGRARFTGRLRHADGRFICVAWALAKEGTGLVGVGHEVAPHADDSSPRGAPERLHAVCRLAGGLAHDFNNLLHTVRNSVELIGRGAIDAAHVARRVELALRVIDNSSKLANQMLAFTNTERLHAPTLPLMCELMRWRDEIAAQLGPCVSLAIEPASASDHASVCVDPGDLKAALVNLAANAREAMPHGGLFTLACSATYLVHDAELPTGHYVMLTATDNGHGMTEAVREHALEPFFTTKDGGHARGMGLSQVYGFARQNGGTVRLASSPQAGTVVSLLFPVASPLSQPPAATQPAFF